LPLELAPGHQIVGETRTGYWIDVSISSEKYRAFVPKPLAPYPQIALTIADTELAGRADRSLGRLDGIADVLPDIDIFLSVWLLKEAVYSSQIEGTQSSLSDLLIFEVDGSAEAVDDLRETANYVTAVKAALAGLKTLPLSMRLLRDAHECLLQSGRGSERQPGIIRTSQNWIGGSRPGTARYVPPPTEYLGEILSDLERFLNDIPERTPLLIKAALAHAQFETIHPFLDGNGRVGRLLVVLLLCADGALRRPLLYVSLFFKRHRDEYYSLLQRVRTDGDWEAWIRFFLEAIEQTAEQAVASARKAMALFAGDEREIRRIAASASGSALQVFRILQVSPIVNAPLLVKRTQLSMPTVNTALQLLISAGIVRELTGRPRNRMFAYERYLTILQEEPADDERRS